MNSGASMKIATLPFREQRRKTTKMGQKSQRDPIDQKQEACITLSRDHSISPVIVSCFSKLTIYTCPVSTPRFLPTSPKADTFISSLLSSISFPILAPHLCVIILKSISASAFQVSSSLFSSVQFHFYRLPALASPLLLDPDPHYFRSGTFRSGSYLTCLSTLPFLISHTSYVVVVLVLLPSSVHSFCQPLCSSSPWMWAAHWTTFTTLPLHPFLFFRLNGSPCPLLNYVQIQISQPPHAGCSPHPGRTATNSAVKSDGSPTQHGPGY